MPEEKIYFIHAQIVDRITHHGLSGLHVRAYDKDPIWDDCLGSSDTDAEGRCTIRFFERDFRDFFEGEPEVYLVVYDAENHELHRTEPVELEEEQTTLHLVAAITAPVSKKKPFKVSVSDHAGPEGNALRVRITLDANALELTPTRFGTKVRLPEFYNTGEEGEPGLPRRVFQVAIPRLARLTGIEARSLKTTVVASEPVPVLPVQPHRPGSSRVYDERRRRDERSPVEPFRMPKWAAPSEEAYRRAAEQPRPPARLVKDDLFGPLQVAHIEVNPVRMRRNAGLEMDEEIEFTLHYRETERDHSALILESGVSSRAQAERFIDLAREYVINPDDIYDYSPLLTELIGDVGYLIITDNQLWDEATIAPIPQRATRGGTIVSAFQELADWKAKRGYTTRVVTVSDIVSGNIPGADVSFKDGARDLQEVIRNFLKWAYREWSILYVLLGGDTQIIPARRVCGALEGVIPLKSDDPPKDDQSFWTGTFLKMKIKEPGEWWPGNTGTQLVNPATGALIPFDAAGTSGPESPGWFYATDDTYQTLSADKTAFVRVNGPSKVVKANLQWLYQWNTLPTDLYYSSLHGKEYSVEGRHDWDALDNGLYGQHNSAVELDDFNFVPHVGLGRAPVNTAAEARNFVAKVIGYEQCREPDGTLLDTDDWLRSIVLVSTNWSHNDIGIWPGNPPKDPPDAYNYFHEPGSDHTRLHIPDTPGKDVEKSQLYAEISATDVRLIPYDPAVQAGGFGWYYTEELKEEPVVIELSFVDIVLSYIILTPMVIVFGPPEVLEPPSFLFNSPDIDGSATDQEALGVQLAQSMPEFDNVVRLYQEDAELNSQTGGSPPVLHLVADSLRDALNGGPHIVSLSGHGNPGGCCYLDSGMAQALTNSHRTFIAYADSCLTNMFDGDDAMGEYLINNTQGGAVAYIGNTRFSWIGVGDDYQRAFFERLMSIRSISLLNDSRYFKTFQSGCDAYAKWVCFTLNLLGDPEMPVWSALPLPLEVEFPATTEAGEPFVVKVTSDGEPASGAAIHLQHEEYTRFAESDDNGSAVFKLTTAPAGKYEVTVTKLGHLPFIGTAERVAKP